MNSALFMQGLIVRSTVCSLNNIHFLYGFAFGELLSVVLLKLVMVKTVRNNKIDCRIICQRQILFFFCRNVSFYALQEQCGIHSDLVKSVSSSLLPKYHLQNNLNFNFDVYHLSIRNFVVLIVLSTIANTNQYELSFA